MNPQDPPHSASLNTNTYADLLDALLTVISPLQTLHQQAIDALEPTVHDLVRSGSSDTQRIEHTLDQLLNHACTPEGLTLFKTLCRHFWTIDPQTTASYVQAYREMWDDDKQNDSEAAHISHRHAA
jgi:hypothetical protein